MMQATFPQGVRLTSPVSTPSTCSEPTCERRSAAGSGRCRSHLADLLRQQGEHIPFTDPDIAGLAAVVVHALNVTDVARYADPGSATVGLNLTIVADDNTQWAIGQPALDLFGTQVSDVFGAMRLAPPKAVPPQVVLRLQVSIPRSNELAIRSESERALRIVMDEVLGTEGYILSVAPAEEGTR